MGEFHLTSIILFSMLTLLSILFVVTVESIFVDDPNCLEAGVPGYNQCYDGPFSETNLRCCNGGGEKIFCLPSYNGSTFSEDKFCMYYDTEDGEPCGATAEFNYLGYCGAGSNCIDGTCVAME